MRCVDRSDRLVALPSAVLLFAAAAAVADDHLVWGAWLGAPGGAGAVVWMVYTWRTLRRRLRALEVLLRDFPDV